MTQHCSREVTLQHTGASFYGMWMDGLDTLCRLDYDRCTMHI